MSRNPDHKDGRISPDTENFLEQFPNDLKNYHLTFVTAGKGVLATFARDNAKHLEEWWESVIESMKADPFMTIQVNRRIFTSMRDLKSGLPIKKMAICLVSSDGVQKISSDEARSAFNTDAATGQAMDPMPATTYEDW